MMKNKELSEFFGRDERTIRRWKNEGMPAHDASAAREWWLMNKHDAPMPSTPGGGDEMLDATIVYRLDGWREIASHPESEMDSMTLDSAAEVFGYTRESLLKMLRMGCPYITRGDFRTGEGFALKFSHVLDWTILLLRAATRAGPRYQWIVDLLHPGRK